MKSDKAPNMKAVIIAAAASWLIGAALAGKPPDFFTAPDRRHEQRNQRNPVQQQNRVRK